MAKQQLGVTHWVHDVDWLESLELLVSRPTVNIEGLVGGYTGPGGKTILPHRAVAKLDLRLVPDMTAAGALAKLKAHLAKRGFGDIEVNMTGGYDPTSTPADAAIIRAEIAVCKRAGIDPILLASQCRILAGVCLHGRAAETPCRPLWAGPRQRSARTGRILRDRVEEPECSGTRRRCEIVRRLPLRTRGHRLVVHLGQPLQPRLDAVYLVTPEPCVFVDLIAQVA